MNIYTIYMATNRINGKSYVGFTSKSLNIRQKDHQKSVRWGSNYYFHNALRKYGWGTFEWEILFQGDDLDFISNMEIYCIAYHGSYSNGYNLTMGGVGVLGLKISEENRKKLSDNGKTLTGEKNPFFGKKHTAEYLKWASESRLGIKHSDETKRKMSKAHKGRLPWNTGKTMTDEQKAKLRGPRKPCLPETKQKISIAKRARDEARRKLQFQQINNKQGE